MCLMLAGHRMYSAKHSRQHSIFPLSVPDTKRGCKVVLDFGYLLFSSCLDCCNGSNHSGLAGIWISCYAGIHDRRECCHSTAMRYLCLR